jgi:hypothetical protein
MTTLRLNFKQLARQAHASRGTRIPVMLDVDELLEQLDCSGDLDIDLRAQLARQHEIALIWSIHDVREVRPDLTPDQAWQVLQLCEDGHDANFGICWETLQTVATDLFGAAGREQSL